jgi:hypothetical protein
MFSKVQQIEKEVVVANLKVNNIQIRIVDSWVSSLACHVQERS